MTAGDHYAGVNALREERVIEHGRRHHANVQDIKPRLVEATGEQVAEHGRAFARIAPKTHTPRAVTMKESADGARQIINTFVGQVAAYDAANVVFAKDVRIHNRPQLNVVRPS